MQPHNRENKPETKDQHNNRVDPQTRALVRVQLQHRARRATGASGAGRAGPGIPQSLLVVCGRATTQSSSRTAGGSRRGRAVHGRAGSRGAGAGASGLGLRAGFSTGGQRRCRAGRGLDRGGEVSFQSAWESRGVFGRDLLKRTDAIELTIMINRQEQEKG